MQLKHHLEKLSHFTLVVDSGSFAAAARKVSQSQPTLMYSVSELERVLDCKLLRRSRKGVELTHAGKTLWDFAVQLEKDVALVEAQLINPGEPLNHLKLASHGPVISSVLANCLVDLKTEFSVELKISSRASSKDLVKMVESGEVNIALVAEAEKSLPSGLECREVFDSYYQFYTTPGENSDSRATRTRSVDISNEPLLFLENAIAGPDQTIAEELDRITGGVSSLYKFDDLEQVKAFALRGQGIGVLPEWYCRHEVETGGLVKVRPRGFPKKFAQHKLFAVFQSEAFVETLADRLIELI